MRWVGEEQSERVIQCLVHVAHAAAEAQRQEEARQEYERWSQQIDAESRLVARLREDNFQRELRDRRQRDELALGGIMILGGILGSKKW